MLSYLKQREKIEGGGQGEGGREGEEGEGEEEGSVGRVQVYLNACFFFLSCEECIRVH